MKTQISRWSDDPAKRRSGIYQQQGRMITDADLNELMELLKRRIDVALGDVIGSGAPRAGDGQGLISGSEAVRYDPDGALLIKRGPIYVDGIQAWLEGSDPSAEWFRLQDQADFPGAPPIKGSSTPPGNTSSAALSVDAVSADPSTHTLYVDVWELPITALQDASQLDSALHGADTATRTQTLAQVKWCRASINPLDKRSHPSKGNAQLGLTLRRGAQAADPCDPCATEIAVEERTGNYLFRLEVHDVVFRDGLPTELVLKWSSENAAEQYDSSSPATDFQKGDWIYEFYSPDTEKRLGLHLADTYAPERGELLDRWPDKPSHPFVRRWDGCARLVKQSGRWGVVNVTAALASQDNGRDLVPARSGSDPTHGDYSYQENEKTRSFELVVQLSNLSLVLQLQQKRDAEDLGIDEKCFVAGDYWLATVREDAKGEAQQVQLASATPLGITHHYMVLAQLSGTKILPFADDKVRRFNFPKLTELSANDIGYEAPRCSNGRLKELLALPAGSLNIKSVLDQLLCGLDADTIPFDAGQGSATLRQRLNGMTVDIASKVSRAGDTMTGTLFIEGVGAGLSVGSSSTNPGKDNLYVKGDCKIDGNLVVQGDTTTISTATLQVEDPIIRVNKDATSQQFSGLEVFRGGTAKNAQIVWDESVDQWKVGLDETLLPIVTSVQLSTQLDAKVNRAGDTMSGALLINGAGLNVGGVSNPGPGNCEILGNLVVKGATTSIESATLEIRDPIVRVNRYLSQQPPQLNGGLEVFRGGGTTKNAQIIWDEAAKQWKVGTEDLLLPIATSEAQHIVTGVVTFKNILANVLMISDDIDPGFGTAWVCVQLGLVESSGTGESANSGDAGFQRNVRYRSESSQGGKFRISIRSEAAAGQYRVRWWAFKPRSGDVNSTVAIEVSITPPSVTMKGGEIQVFTASVKHLTGTDAEVTWRAEAGAGGATPVGEVTVAGPGTTQVIYTSPLLSGTYRLIATSKLDTSKFAVATIVVNADVTVQVTPATSTLALGKTLALSAQVQNTPNKKVTWSVKSVNGGSINSASDTTALYNSQGAVAGTHTIEAVSAADPTKKFVASIQVVAVTVSVSPPSVPLLNPGSSTMFSAGINFQPEPRASWTAPDGGTLSATLGVSTIFTAPSAPGAYRAVATSVADNTKSVTAPVTVPLVINVIPQTATMAAGTTKSFSISSNAAGAGVNWSANRGTILTPTATTVIFEAPFAEGPCTLRATSKTDATRFGIASITVTAKESGEKSGEKIGKEIEAPLSAVAPQSAPLAPLQAPGAESQLRTFIQAEQRPQQSLPTGDSDV